MAKYVKFLTEKEVRAEREANPDLAAFMDKGGINGGGYEAMELSLPTEVVKWIDEHEGPETRQRAGEAYSCMLDRCMKMLTEGLPKDVMLRVSPREALEIAADEVVEAVFVFPFHEAGLKVNKMYHRLAEMTLKAGPAGADLTVAFVCAAIHRKVVALAEGRDPLPDIDPALAEKATHKTHATIN